jgi:serine/threonine protein phosphatase 1
MICVIGDIHGCFNTLTELISTVKAKYPEAPLYSVGDLVDRGNYSYEVLEYFISSDIKFTPGNHDYMFLYYMRDPLSTIGRAWLYNGYESTMASYDGKRDKLSEHLELIRKSPLFFDLEDCFISHAGISIHYKNYMPNGNSFDSSALNLILKNDIEEEQGILWTRDELLDIGKLQIVGHTRRQEILHSKKNNVLYIDTSVYTGNKLSAVIIEDNTLVDVLSIPTHSQDII